ncbi:hypothetical protein [Amycolatopsis sp. NPDC051903]|uniref:hypothetical protein n=1 Tax=Amycolatopsis sp. NPDC051903 TaxID=3363936 RepID=UPI00378FE20F
MDIQVGVTRCGKPSSCCTGDDSGAGRAHAVICSVAIRHFRIEVVHVGRTAEFEPGSGRIRAFPHRAQFRPMGRHRKLAA